MLKFKKVLPLLLAVPQITLAEITLEDIQVTTPLRVPEKEENVIADTTVINSDEIERAGLSTLPQLLQQQPGIEITNSGGQEIINSKYSRYKINTYTDIT